MSGTLPWYVARASGLVAWGTLAASVVWGLLMTTRIMKGRVRNNWLLDLHRWLGALALIFTGVHVGALLLDTYVHFGLASLLVPFAATWHPVAVAWGVTALYLLAAVELTSLARRRLNHRLWRRVHMLSFPLFVLSTVHGLTAGTDGRTPMALITAVLVAAGVGALCVVRLRQLDQPGAPVARAGTTPGKRRPTTPAWPDDAGAGRPVASRPARIAAGASGR